MNVVVVNDYGWVNGGSSQVALSSARALAARGHAVTVFTAVGPADGAGGVDVVCTGQQEIAADSDRLRAAVQGLWNFQAQRRLRQLLARMDPSDTVLHFHGWTKALSSSVIREAAQQGFGSATTLHEYFSACPNGGFFDYQRQVSCHRTPLGLACVSTHCDARSYPQKLWRVGRQLVQRGAGMFPAGMRHFITLSRFSAEVLGPFLPAEAHLHRVPNPVDTVRAAAVDAGEQEGFAFIGRLAPEKGCVLLARAAVGIDAPLTFVGDGPERKRIEAVHSGARVTGWLAPDAAQRQLRGVRALVLPSLWHEVQPLVVLEAAAAGVPAVVPDHCAARESVVDGVTGLWFRSGDETDLRDKLRRLHEQPALAASLGRAAYERYWRDPPTLERHVGQLEVVYGAVLATRRRHETA